MARLSDLVREQTSSARGGDETPLRDDQAAASVEEGRAARWYAAARREVRGAGDAIRLHEPPRIEVYGELAQQLVSALRQGDEFVRWALQGRTEDYLVDNAVHVAVLSVKIGIGLQYSDKELERLAVAALLHDLGMWTLPAALIEKPGMLTDEERVAVRSHPERGRRALAGLGMFGEWLSTVSAQEHERWDGSGYPCRLNGSQIAEPAQIIGVADVFDALITARPYRKRITPHQAIRELMVHAKTMFPHRVLKSLGDQITLYPVGTAVRLNTGEVGTVSKVNPRYPLRPSLAVTGDGSSGTSKARKELDLAQAISIHIAEVLQLPTES